MSQREDPAGKKSIEEFKAHLDATRPGWRQDGSQVSGAQLQAFREGWAKLGFAGDLAHHFKRIGVTDEAVSRCGDRGTVRLLFGQGNFKRCRICQRSVDRRTPT